MAFADAPGPDRGTRGDLEEAVSLKTRAIASSRNSGTRYPQEDEDYLNRLVATSTLGAQGEAR